MALTEHNQQWALKKYKTPQAKNKPVDRDVCTSFQTTLEINRQGNFDEETQPIGNLLFALSLRLGLGETAFAFL